MNGVNIRIQCFNGAATLSLRKLPLELCHLTLTLELQWGRNFIVAETGCLPDLCRCHAPGFNGAATLSLRKWRPAQNACLSLSCASMGPQLYRCGNSSSRRPRANGTCSFNGAATLSLRKWLDQFCDDHSVDVASMGPQLYRCGNYRPNAGLAFKHSASMGPQLYRCGNT